MDIIQIHNEHFICFNCIKTYITTSFNNHIKDETDIFNCICNLKIDYKIDDKFYDYLHIKNNNSNIMNIYSENNNPDIIKIIINENIELINKEIKDENIDIYEKLIKIINYEKIKNLFNEENIYDISNLNIFDTHVILNYGSVNENDYEIIYNYKFNFDLYHLFYKILYHPDKSIYILYILSYLLKKILKYLNILIKYYNNKKDIYMKHIYINLIKVFLKFIFYKELDTFMLHILLEKKIINFNSNNEPCLNYHNYISRNIYINNGIYLCPKCFYDNYEKLQNLSKDIDSIDYKDLSNKLNDLKIE